MELKLEEFVAETLNQIIAGVVSTQEKAKDTHVCINPRSIIPQKDDIVYIEFDVAISGTKQTETKGGLGIFVAAISFGTQGTTDISNRTLSRIKFSVPLAFPE